MLWALNVLAYLINAGVVGSSNFGALGASNAEVSDDNPTFITPAGWAFSIWGVIFLFELIFVIWGAIPANRESDLVLDGVGCWFAIACLLQAGWAVVFAQELLVVSAILLCLIAFSLSMAVISLKKVHCEKPPTVFTIPFWTVFFPIGLHGGWTLAASLVNINVALELDDAGSELAALILSVVGAAVAAAFGSVVYVNQPYMLAIAWAIAGISSKEGYRLEKLGEDLSDGVSQALQGLWIALLCLGVVGVIAGVRHYNDAASESPKRPSARRSGGNDLSSEIYS